MVIKWSPFVSVIHTSQNLDKAIATLEKYYSNFS